MEINFADAKKAVRRGARSANHALDVVHDVGQRKVRQAHEVADDAIEVGDRAARSTVSAAQSAHDWMEAKPHVAALAAFAAGIVIGAFFSPRR
jgi:ElaB/YqjD/DUF883 family membrane-anchored ribosome-binding protein